MSDEKHANDNDDDRLVEPASQPAANDNYILADDVLLGAAQIALWLYGHRRHRRKVYHLAKTSRLPHYLTGSIITARKSVLLAWIKDQEERSVRKMG